VGRMNDLNKLLFETRARKINHKDAFWLRGHLQQFEDIEYWDIEGLKNFNPVRNNLFRAVFVALHAPSARLS